MLSCRALRLSKQILLTTLPLLALTACGSKDNASNAADAAGIGRQPSAQKCQPASTNAVLSDALVAECEDNNPRPPVYEPNLPLPKTEAPSPSCTTDHFTQNGGALGTKLDILFVLDTTSRIGPKWLAISEKLDYLAQHLKGVDVRYGVILAHVDEMEGRLYAPPGEPRVLDSRTMSTREISQHLKNIIWSTGNAFDDRGIGEAAFYSLHKLVTKNLADTRRAGFLRADAGLAVLFQSDEQEIGSPISHHPVHGIRERCDAYYPPIIKKEFYDDEKVSISSTFAAVKAVKGGQMISMNAFVNVDQEDMEHYLPVFQSPDGKPCIYASPGYGYFEMVAKTGGLLRSVHEDTSRSLDRLGRALHDGITLQHDFPLSHPSTQVDANTIQSLVDGGVTAHTYSPASDEVHLDYAGKLGSKIDIHYCEPQSQTGWELTGFTGTATQTTATLTWQTSALATSGKILWGTSASSLTNTAPEAAPTKAHSVTVNGLTANTTYYFQAVSTDAFGLEKRSAVIALTTQQAPLPDWAITGFAGTSTQTSVALSFATSAYATKGFVKWGTSADSLSNSTAVDPSAVTSHAFTVTGLTANTTYYFQAVATDDRGQTQSSGVIAVTTQPIPLPIWDISGFAGTPTQTSVALSFATSAYATNGKVIWGTSADSLDQSTASDSATKTHSFNVTGLTPATTYYFQAIAGDDRGQTKSSAVIAVTTAAIPLPVWSITGFQGTATQTTVTLSFATNDYATTGAVLWGTSSGNLNNATPSDAAATKSHTFTVSGLTPSTTYYFQAVASDDRGQSHTSAVIAVRTSDIPLPTWTLANFAGTPTQTSVALAFTTSEYATTGKVMWGTSSGALTNTGGPDVAPVNAHAFTVTGLTPNTTYYFQAVATDDRGQTKKSDVVAITTLPIPLPDWSITGFNGSPTQTTVTLSFFTSTYATTGKILWGTSAGNLSHATAPDAAPTTSHAFTVSGLTAGTTYYFQASATDDRGQTHVSDVIAVTTDSIPLPVWTLSGFNGSPSRNSIALSFMTSEYATKGFVKWGASADALNNVTATDTTALNQHGYTVAGLAANTTYYFQAVATDDRGQTQSSAVIAVTTLPPPPPVWSITGFAGTPTQTTVALSFATSAYATTGKVLWGTSADSLTNSTTPDASPVTAHAFTVSGLTASTTYYFQAVATDDRGQTHSSAVISVRTSDIPLPVWAISGFAGTSTQSTATLTFATSAYATTGKVLWGTSSGNLNNSTSSDASPVTTHSFTVSGLTPSTTYYFQAVASDDRGQTHMSGVVAVRTADIPLPTWTISNFTGTPAINSIALSFATSEYATTGKVLWGTSSDALNNVAGPDTSPANSHAYTVSGLAANTTYYFQAVATDDRGQTHASGVLSVTTLPLPLPVWSITGFQGTSDMSSVALTFSTSEYATTGKILWGTSAGSLTNSTGSDSSPVNNHSFTVTGLSPSTTYFFQAVASDDRGQTKSSAVISVTTQAAPQSWVLSGFDGTTTATTASLIWNTGTVPTKATILVGLSPTNLSFMTVNVPTFSASHVQTVAGLSPATTYYFQVVATDAAGTTQTSGVISKTTKASRPNRR